MFLDQECKHPAMCPVTGNVCNILCAFFRTELDVAQCKGIVIGAIRFLDEDYSDWP
jgi:hypothetical protein